MFKFVVPFKLFQSFKYITTNTYTNFKLTNNQKQNIGLATRQDSCLVQSECPEKCKCVGAKVVCSGLKEIPRNIPTSVSVL